MSNKLKLLIIGGLIVAVAGVVGFHIMETRREFSGKKEPERVSNQIQVQKLPNSKIDTSKWKVYKNEKYSYQIKYPGDWKISKGRFCHPYQYACDSVIIIQKPKHTPLFWAKIAVFDNLSGITLKDWVYNFEKVKELKDRKIGELLYLKNIKVGNRKAIRIGYIPLTKQGEMRDIIYLSRNSLIYAISFHYNVYYTRHPENTSEGKIYQKMLSTFKFTE